MCFVKVCRSINFNNLIRKGNKFKSCLIHINYTVTPYLPITFLNHMQLHQMFVNTLMQGINLNHVYMNICFSEWMVDREVIRLIKLHFFQHLVMNVVKQLTLYKRCGVAEWLMCSFAWKDRTLMLHTYATLNILMLMLHEINNISLYLEASCNCGMKFICA